MKLELTHAVGIVFKSEQARTVVDFKKETGKKNRDIFLKGIEAFLEDKNEVEQAV